LILHGLFQSSGSFITSEDRSLAFWLASQGGYQVYLGNTRAVYGMGHRHLSTSDPRFWDWTIRELAMYDLPALVEHVCRETGYDKEAHLFAERRTHAQTQADKCQSVALRVPDERDFIVPRPRCMPGP
jgi:hypothetical protein